MRINQFLAHNLGLSRREVDKYIEKGLVEVDGRLAEFFDQIEEGHKVRVFYKNDWKTIDGGESKITTALLYKPIFCVTTRHDPQKRKTLYDFMPKSNNHLKAAGRLDYMSEGLLVLTSDGDLIFKITHAKGETKKVYLVGTKFELKKSTLADFKKGIELEGYQLNSVLVIAYQDHLYDYLKLEPNYHWYYFTLTEGRNNQIRKMCALYNNQVNRLIRVEHGEYKLTPELYSKKFLTIV